MHVYIIHMFTHACVMQYYMCKTLCISNISATHMITPTNSTHVAVLVMNPFKLNYISNNMHALDNMTV